MELKHLPTPALVVDEEIFLKNEAAMAALLKGGSLRLRPHFKSHKCAAIAHRQIQSGAIGMTCAKLDEAIDLAESGIEDILIANQITDREKISRLAHLARACRLTVCVDDEENARALEEAAAFAGATVHCLVEYEIGMQRCGLSDMGAVVALAKYVDGCAQRVFDGIQAYTGHISHVVSQKEREDLTAANEEKIRTLLSLLAAEGLAVRTLSGGSTGTARIKKEAGLYTELQAGSYLFMDATYGELALPFESSLFVLATVVSVREGLAVVDAGVKSCGVDQGMPRPLGFSVSEVVASEEHFQLHNPSKQLSVGDRVLLVPAHCCSTVNLHENLYFVRDGKVTDRIPVTARGCFR